MRYKLLHLIFSIAVFAGVARSASDSAVPHYTADGQLVFPADYREWIFLSSGLGMTYGPAAQASATDPHFDNVFVSPAAYRSFLQTGTWPDKTIFVLEVRAAESKGSINNGGHFQSDVTAIEAEVKDERRFPTKWKFFGFGDKRTSASVFPPSASCYGCHAQNGAVDNTFVQFYPTLRKVAQEKGTFKGTSH